MNNTKSIIRAFAFGLLLANKATASVASVVLGNLMAFMKRTTLLAMAGIVVSLMLVACGPNNSSSSTTSNDVITGISPLSFSETGGSTTLSFTWANLGVLDNVQRDINNNTAIASYNITYEIFTRASLMRTGGDELTIPYTAGTQNIAITNLNTGDFITITSVDARDAAGILLFPIRIANNLSRILIGDSDRDNVLNAADVDDDGDGLIEINTANQLWSIRYNLEGTGLDLFPGSQDNTSGGDSTGCPANGGCIGYELASSIDLETIADPQAASSPPTIAPNMLFGTGQTRNWLPIGRCVDDSCALSEQQNQHFSAIFEGNGHRIDNMRVLASAEEEADGLGFFASVQAGPQGGRIRNMHLFNASVQIAAGVTSATGVGGMAGFVHSNGGGNANDRTAIMASSVVADDIQGQTSVGGLVGSVTGNSIVRESVAYVVNMNGERNLGGLVGSLGTGQLANTFAFAFNIVGDGDIGGLVGEAGAGSAIATSYSLGKSIDNRTDENVHPLVGSSQGRVEISYWRQGNSAVEFNKNNEDDTTFYEIPTISPPVIFPTYGMDQLISRGHSLTDLRDGMYSMPVMLLYANWNDQCANINSPVWDFGLNADLPIIRCFASSSYLTSAVQQALLAQTGVSSPASLQDLINRIPNL